MNETGRFLDGFARSRSDIVQAKIVSLNDDGSYMCRLFASDALVRASPSNPNERYTVNSLVQLAAPSASRTVIGTSYTVLQRAPRQQRGISATTPDAIETRKAARPVVLGVDPLPLEIEAGGDGDEQTITGFALTEAATYEDGIEEDAPPTVTDTEVTMRIAAPTGTPLGDYDLTISGITIKDAVRVVERDEAEHTAAVYIPGASIFKVSVDDGALLNTSAPLDEEAVQTFTIAPDTIIAFYDGGGAAILNRDLDIIASVTGVSGGLLRFPPPNEWAQIAYDGADSLWYGSGNVLCKVNATTGDAVAIHTAGSSYEGVAVDGANVFACARDTKVVRKFDRASGVLLASVDVATFDYLNTLTSSVSSPVPQPRNLVFSDGHVLVLCADVADSSRLVDVWLDPATMASAFSPDGTSALTFDEAELPTDMFQLFIVGAMANMGDDVTLVARRSDTSTGPHDVDPNGDSYVITYSYAKREAELISGPSSLSATYDDLATDQKAGRFLTGIAHGLIGGKLYVLGADDDGLVIDVYDFEGDTFRAWVSVTAPEVPTTPRPCGFLAFT